jgi:O-glycosyl hydrolase
VAFENPDGEKVLVITNPGVEGKVQLQMAAQRAEVLLPKGSVATLIWR